MMQTLECPHCGKPVVVASMESRRRGRLWVWLGVWTVVLVALGVVGYIYRAHLLAGLDLVAEGTGSRTTAALSLVGALLVLIILLAWLFLPFILYFGLRKMRRRSDELHEANSLCLSRLAPIRTETGATAAREESQGAPRTPAQA
jgi:H+/Cl- antiporter ClcA